MKNFCVLFVLFMVPLLNMAQTTEVRSKTKSEISEVKVLPDSLKAIKIHNDSINNQVAIINSHLNSIQIKWDWILENPEEKAIAEEKKWFEDMTKTKARLETKKQTLLNSLK